MNIKYFRYLRMCTASYCVRYIFEYFAAYVHPPILRLRCFRNRDINLKEVYTIVNGSTKKICKLNKTQSMLVSIRESLGMWVYVCVWGGGCPEPPGRSIKFTNMLSQIRYSSDPTGRYNYPSQIRLSLAPHPIPTHEDFYGSAHGKC